jgi:UDP-N-acetylglucosamine:LPS N-acetylglucosamine transferase
LRDSNGGIQLHIGKDCSKIMVQKKKKILAVASSGGHWIQLLRLRPAFDGYEVVFASTNASNHTDVEKNEFYTLKRVHRNALWNLMIMIPRLFFMLKKIRPSIIITTGSAAGLMTLMVGRLFSTKNVWIDSIANVDQLSTSGKMARHFADLYLTQWEELAKPEGPKFSGSVL